MKQLPEVPGYMWSGDVTLRSSDAMLWARHEPSVRPASFKPAVLQIKLTKVKRPRYSDYWLLTISGANGRNRKHFKGGTKDACVDIAIAQVTAFRLTGVAP